MVDPEEQCTVASLPPCRALAGRELQYLQRIAFRVMKIKGTDPSGIGIPVGQALRAARHRFDLKLPQPCVGPIHIADDDGDVLEPAIVAVRIERNGPATRTEKLH